MRVGGGLGVTADSCLTPRIPYTHYVAAAVALPQSLPAGVQCGWVVFQVVTTD
jgi:hypothetical protein